MNIKLEISKILQECDFLVIPGFGAFKADRTMPYFTSNGDIVQSERKITFESVIKKDFSNKLFTLLLDRIPIPSNYLQIELQDFLDKIQNQLRITGKYDWEGIGSFFSKSNGEIDFYPEIQKVPANTYSSVSNAFVSRIEEPKLNVTYTSLSQETAIQTPTSIFSEPNPENTLPKENTKTIKSMYFLFPVLFLLGGLVYNFVKDSASDPIEKSSLLSSTDSSKKTISQIPDTSIIDPQSYQPTEIEKNSLKIDRIENEQVKDLEKEETGEREENSNDNSLDNSQQNTWKKSQEELANNSSRNDSKRIEVTIGKFEVKENANKLADNLAKKLGIYTKIKPENNYFRVYSVANNDEEVSVLVKKIKDYTGEKPFYVNK
ncbi:MAG: SPOR domain-containing protein [Leadbetterella sp.]